MAAKTQSCQIEPNARMLKFAPRGPKSRARLRERIEAALAISMSLYRCSLVLPIGQSAQLPVGHGQNRQIDLAGGFDFAEQALDPLQRRAAPAHLVPTARD